MKKEKMTAREQLLELERLVKKIMRKSLKDNTLDFTCQITISNLDEGKVKYAAQISSPAKGVQPITFVFDSFNDLKNALESSEKELNKKEIEKVFHQSRINTYKSKIAAHEARLVEMEKETDEDEEIEMEQV